MGWGKRKRIPETGSAAPSFRLKDLDGKERSLQDLLADGPVLLAFYKVSCPVCQFTLPFLERLHKVGGDKIRFFAVSQDDARDSRGFHKKHDLSFPVLLDEERAGYAASNAFGISSVPTCFLVEKDGTVSWAMEGFAKTELEALGRRAGVAPFQAGEYVPEWKAG